MASAVAHDEDEWAHHFVDDTNITQHVDPSDSNNIIPDTTMPDAESEYVETAAEDIHAPLHPPSPACSATMREKRCVIESEEAITLDGHNQEALTPTQHVQGEAHQHSAEHSTNCCGSPAASTPAISPMAGLDTPPPSDSLTREPEIVESEALRAHRQLHAKAKNVLPPEKPKQSRYWVGVLSPAVYPKDIRKERDLIWMKGNAVSLLIAMHVGILSVC